MRRPAVIATLLALGILAWILTQALLPTGTGGNNGTAPPGAEDAEAERAEDGRGDGGSAGSEVRPGLPDDSGAAGGNGARAGGEGGDAAPGEADLSGAGPGREAGEDPGAADPEVPTDPDNGATYYWRLTVHVEGWPEGFRDRLSQMADDGLDPTRDVDAPAIWAPALEELDRALEAEQVHFPCYDDMDLETTFPHLQAGRAAGDLLAAEARRLAGLGLQRRALERLADGYEVAQDLEQDGPLIAALVGDAIRRRTTRRMKTFLLEQDDLGLYREAIGVLQSAESSRQPMVSTLQAEIDGFGDLFRLESAGQLRTIIGPDATLPEGEELAALLEREQAAYLDLMERMRTAALMHTARALEELRAIEDEISAEEHPLTGSIVPAISRVVVVETRILALLRGMRLWCAIRHAFRRDGVLPDTLGVLTPEPLDHLPRDPFTEEGFLYRITGPDAFILYSVGEDLTDDGGVAPADLLLEPDPAR